MKFTRNSMPGLFAGEDLDGTQASEQDDVLEEIVSEDEEQYLCLGGENHTELEEVNTLIYYYKR